MKSATYPINEVVRGLKIELPKNDLYTLIWVKNGVMQASLLNNVPVHIVQRAMGLFLEVLDWETAPIGELYPAAALDHKIQVRLAHLVKLIMTESDLDINAISDINSSAYVVKEHYSDLVKEDPR